MKSLFLSTCALFALGCLAVMVMVDNLRDDPIMAAQVDECSLRAWTWAK